MVKSFISRRTTKAKIKDLESEIETYKEAVKDAGEAFNSLRNFVLKVSEKGSDFPIEIVPFESTSREAHAYYLSQLEMREDKLRQEAFKILERVDSICRVY